MSTFDEVKQKAIDFLMSGAIPKTIGSSLPDAASKVGQTLFNQFIYDPVTKKVLPSSLYETSKKSIQATKNYINNPIPATGDSIQPDYRAELTKQMVSDMPIIAGMTSPLTSLAGKSKDAIAKTASKLFSAEGSAAKQLTSGVKQLPYKFDEVTKKVLPQPPQGGVVRSPSKYGKTELGSGGTSDMVARERFNIPKLKKIGAGSDRDVYDLGNDAVLKITKTSRGLSQNASSADYYAENSGLIPKTIEEGKNYLVKEKVLPPDKNVKAMIKELSEVGVPMGENTNYALFDKQRQKFINVLNKYGFPGDDLLNYDPLWMDLTRIKNWGTTKEGLPIMLDEGNLNGRFVKENITNGIGGKNLQDPEFFDIYNQSRMAKKKFGDLDRNTMYGVGGLLGGAGLYGMMQNRINDEVK